MPRCTILAAVDHEDLVGVTHGGEPVGDHQGGAALQRGVQGALDGVLRLGVQVGGGLVEHHDVRRLEQQPSDRQPLALPAGEPVATVPHHRVEAVGQRATRPRSVRASRAAHSWSVPSPGAA